MNKRQRKKALRKVAFDFCDGMDKILATPRAACITYLTPPPEWVLPSHAVDEFEAKMKILQKKLRPQIYAAYGVKNEPD